MKRNARAYHRQSSCEVKVFEGAGDKRLDDGIHTDPSGARTRQRTKHPAAAAQRAN